MLLQCAAYFEIIFLLKSSDDQAATRDAYRVAKQQRVTARRALEWIGTSKACGWFLDMKYQTCFDEVE